MGNQYVGLEVVEVPLETMETVRGSWKQPHRSVVNILHEFVDRDMIFAEVRHGYKNVMSARSSFANALKREGLTGKVRVISRIDRIFLLRTGDPL